MVETIKTDDLSTITRAIEVMRFISQEMTEDYFYQFNPDNKADHFGIIWEFTRAAARAEAISDYLHMAATELESLGLPWFKRCGTPDKKNARCCDGRIIKANH